jgi:hypothetical protein
MFPGAFDRAALAHESDRDGAVPGQQPVPDRFRYRPWNSFDRSADGWLGAKFLGAGRAAAAGCFAAHGFFAAQGFLAAQGLAVLAAHGFFAAHGFTFWARALPDPTVITPIMATPVTSLRTIVVPPCSG